MRNGNRLIAACALAMFAALVVVGISSHGVLRHLVQSAPVWPVLWLAMRRSPLTRWAALPVFLF